MNNSSVYRFLLLRNAKKTKKTFVLEEKPEELDRGIESIMPPVDNIPPPLLKDWRKDDDDDEVDDNFQTSPWHKDIM